MRRLVAAIGTVVLALAVAATPASAQVEVVIEADADLREPTGTTVEILSDFQVPPEYQGYTCTGVAQASNNSSVREGNDLILTTGDTTATFANVERAQGVTTPMVPETITVGPTASLSVFLGSSRGRYSGDVSVILTCTPPPTTTTTTTTSTTSTTSTTTSTTSTTVPTTTTTLPTTTTSIAATTTAPPPTVAQSTVAQSTIAETGTQAWGPATFGGLALITIGALFLLLVEFWRRQRSHGSTGD